MKQPHPGTTLRASRLAAGSLVALALVISGCSSPSSPAATGSPFQSGGSAAATGPAQQQTVHSTLSPDPAASGSVTATVTVTASGSTASGSTESRAATSNSTTSGRASSAAPTSAQSTSPSSVPLNYDTTIAAPPVPIGAAGTKVTTTQTMETVTPTAMASAPYPAISTLTHIPRPADMPQTDPVQLAAAFVSLMESPSATDSRADNAALRAAPFATQALRDLLVAQADAMSAQQPTVGTDRVTIRSAVLTSATPKAVSVAVLYDQITIISASENYNQQKWLLRIVTLQQGSDSTWLVAGYRSGAN